MSGYDFFSTLRLHGLQMVFTNISCRIMARLVGVMVSPSFLFFLINQLSSTLLHICKTLKFWNQNRAAHDTSAVHQEKEKLYYMLLIFFQCYVLSHCTSQMEVRELPSSVFTEQSCCNECCRVSESVWVQLRQLWRNNLVLDMLTLYPS